MRLYPAIDMLGGNAVRLVKGDFDASKVYDQDPLAAASTWVEQGAQWLHVVDLDGAKQGVPVNLNHLRRIVQLGVPVQFGGGLRSMDAVAAAFDAGASRVILGTAIFTEPELLSGVMQTYGVDRVLAGIDARNGYVATHGWVQATEVPAREAIERWHGSGEGVRHFVFTSIDHDGMLDGPSREEVVMAASAVGSGTVIVSGGIGQLEHLEALARWREEEQLDSIAGVIVGKALYEERFTVAAARAALGEEDI
jgi:phosphoribosylformimino-5-aminoimidazole carboxamide ribotide isomerase